MQGKATGQPHIVEEIAEGCASDDLYIVKRLIGSASAGATDGRTAGRAGAEIGGGGGKVLDIVSGAAGNLLDRVTVGSVVDFVDVYWHTHHFWAFNVADSAISIGVAIMILDMLGAGPHASKTV